MMDIKIDTTNVGGRVLAYEGETVTVQLDFTFNGNVMSIDHTRSNKEKAGVEALLVNAANEFAIRHRMKVNPACSFAEAWYQRHPQFKDILGSQTSE